MVQTATCSAKSFLPYLHDTAVFIWAPFLGSVTVRCDPDYVETKDVNGNNSPPGIPSLAGKDISSLCLVDASWSKDLLVRAGAKSGARVGSEQGGRKTRSPTMHRMAGPAGFANSCERGWIRVGPS